MDNSQLKLLQKPLSLKWRVRSAYPNKINPTHVMLVGYIDSRQVQDLLDEVVGAENWQDEYFECKNKQFCRIGIKINNEWIWKGDSGAETSTEAGKGETSDAFKRAAVKWGINRTAYKVGEVKLPCKMYESRPYPVDESGRFLKGEGLYSECNRLGKTEDLEIEFDQSFESMAQIAEAAKANKTSKRITKPKVIKP
ncbi:MULTISPECIES: Rad52/Rad22 family DNA repair protein [unclassified Chryseobacterium]|uniref:Rad52/Rad22 family DNA repair protein n=1 Tax=unclassified Chryseobacterium TaxID=2593645 RepID=UPI00285309CF|nr:Rad52/Rad22 family DNA repair protein [Chryseobacterium sp. CFS7]MDR4892238.1 Rad52/Rad22 family DNA repair protein [Chryseobacterium sp. CFS7]